ncbi:hypothetical protein KUTeg_008850 [Tegillarca granosa]|uniref:Uncharacterized protein n=1 Tax=Tegillarca granosa TaxID=220873 RepID=A0ABQ9FA99_TEGGR|nr:hypothetical protein KUTeg_008850 [Tegillarca granosa]
METEVEIWRTDATRVVQSSNELTSVSKIFSQVYYRYLLTSFNLTKSWFQNKNKKCRNQFIGYGHQFARLRNVIFLPESSQGQFKLFCDLDRVADYQFLSQTKEVPISHLNVWMKTLGNTDKEYPVEKTSDVTTLAVFRYKFVNLYNQMTDFYNAFLIMKLLNLKPEKTDILLTDGNLPGSLDKVWDILYGHYVAGIQMDQQDIRDQVQWLSQTDILVGMHGAGMSGIMSLPSHAGVLELFPSYYSPFNYHFQAMAKWRKLHYLRWQNMNPTNEYPDSFTYIPTPVVTQRLTSLYYAMCGHKPDRR